MTTYPAVGSTVYRRYRIADLLEETGSELVYRARDLLQREAEVRLHLLVLPGFDTTQRSAFAQKMESQVERLRTLSLRHLEAVLAYVDYQGMPGIVFGHTQGLRLKALASPQCSVQQALTWGLQLAEILGALHSATPFVACYHLKPAHVELVDEHCVITRWGYETPEHQPTETSDYISVHATMRRDHYALGALLYELLTGQEAASAESREAALAAHGSDPLQPLASLRSDLPLAVTLLMERLLDLGATDPFHSPEELVTAVRHTLEALPPRPDATPAPQTMPERPRRLAPTPQSLPTISDPVVIAAPCAWWIPLKEGKAGARALALGLGVGLACLCLTQTTYFLQSLLFLVMLGDVSLDLLYSRFSDKVRVTVLGQSIETHAYTRFDYIEVQSIPGPNFWTSRSIRVKLVRADGTGAMLLDSAAASVRAISAVRFAKKLCQVTGLRSVDATTTADPDGPRLEPSPYYAMLVSSQDADGKKNYDPEAEAIEHALQSQGVPNPLSSYLGLITNLWNGASLHERLRDLAWFCFWWKCVDFVAVDIVYQSLVSPMPAAGGFAEESFKLLIRDLSYLYRPFTYVVCSGYMLYGLVDTNRVDPRDEKAIQIFWFTMVSYVFLVGSLALTPH